MIDPAVFTAISAVVGTFLTGLGAAAYGFRRLTAANVKALESRVTELETDVAEEQARTKAERARTEEARRETDQVRREKESLRREKDLELDQVRGLRNADRLQHEAEMQQRVQELGGAS